MKTFFSQNSSFILAVRRLGLFIYKWGWWLTNGKVAPNRDAFATARRAAVLAGPLIVALVLVFVGGAASAAPARAAAPLQLFYRVSHSVVGDVGWYSCTVEPLAGGATQGNAREHIDVRMLGIPVYHLDASSTERWAGNRLISFHAMSDKADCRLEISGKAKGGRFIVTSPQGILTTAVTVHPVEPRAANFLHRRRFCTPTPAISKRSGSAAARWPRSPSKARRPWSANT
jgi:hypothetical protein